MMAKIIDTKLNNIFFKLSEKTDQNISKKKF